MFITKRGWSRGFCSKQVLRLLEVVVDEIPPPG